MAAIYEAVPGAEGLFVNNYHVFAQVYYLALYIKNP
jgi:hypothetical protein